MVNGKYEIVVGLETHVELSTKTKAFCSCKNEFGGMVNSNTCPVCLGLPGAMSVLNKAMVEYAIKMGKACNCKINNVTKMDRKHYFYPDLIKGYQLSQLDIPLCQNGMVEIMLGETGETKNIRIHQIHIEEDVGKLIHGEEFSGSLIDYNRSGVPLIEIVTEPDFRSAEEAKAYLDTIRSILLYIGVSDCKMQEGSIRCDVNVSVRPYGQKEYGTRVEMKNVSSFSAVERAINYESNRQIEMLEKGIKFSQETRKWDDVKGCNITMREKESAYCYTEPNFKTIYIPDVEVKAIENSLPELPNVRLKRFMSQYGLSHFDANLLVENRARGEFYEEVCKLNKNYKAVVNWLNGDIAAYLAENNKDLVDTKLTPSTLASLVTAIDSKTISNTAAKEVLPEILTTDKSVESVIKEKGLAQVSDTAELSKIVFEILAQNEKAVTDFHNGKTNVLGFLIGMCMRASKGKGNPEIFKDLITKELNK